ncbi:hypothetical protein F1Z41_00910 [Clostridium perfringens]|nr:hypothetical protein [Clostridium perfringens]MCW5197836.1 hypothetical protein [Clostridium perfringens]
MLNNKDDEIDENTKEYVDGYEKEYREFSSVLTNVSNIPQNKYGYKFLAKIYKELEGINTANNKKKNRYIYMLVILMFMVLFMKSLKIRMKKRS